jgi:prepilin-type processing-associated H-X9-DG protein
LAATVFVLGLLALLLFTFTSNYKTRSQRVRCIGNLKKIGVAMRGFAIDLPGASTNSTTPQLQQASSTETAQPEKFSGVFQCFQSLSNELVNPAILICPADTGRIAARDFGFAFSDANVSYFLGVDGLDTVPNSFLAGDRLMQIDGMPVKAGLVTLQATNVLKWTAHQGSGNILLGDGSVQTLSSSSLSIKAPATYRLAFP